MSSQPKDQIRHPADETVVFDRGPAEETADPRRADETVVFDRGPAEETADPRRADETVVFDRGPAEETADPRRADETVVFDRGPAEETADPRRADETVVFDQPNGQLMPGGFRWPSADPAGRLTPGALRPPADPGRPPGPGGFRWPPVDPAGILIRPPSPPQTHSSRPLRIPIEQRDPGQSQQPDHVASSSATAVRESSVSEELPPSAPKPKSAAPDGLGQDVPLAERPTMFIPRDQDAGITPKRSRRPRVVVVILILVLLVAGDVELVLFLRHVGHHAAARGTTSEQADNSRNGLAATVASRQATAWIVRHVSRNTSVACDPLMCSALEARGIPAASLLILRTAAEDPRRAEVVVVTPTVRKQFGQRMTTVYAPSVIGSFGSGTTRVSVQVTAPDGARAYLAALRRDVTARQAEGARLTANQRIQIAAQARKQLAAGDVDSRLLIMLPALAAVHPVEVVAFGDAGPGASPGIPLCSADLSVSGRAAGMTDASYLSWLGASVRAMFHPFSGSTAILRQGDQLILRVEFSRPSPLGLLGQG